MSTSLFCLFAISSSSERNFKAIAGYEPLHPVNAVVECRRSSACCSKVLCSTRRIIFFLPPVATKSPKTEMKIGFPSSCLFICRKPDFGELEELLCIRSRCSCPSVRVTSTAESAVGRMFIEFQIRSAATPRPEDRLSAHHVATSV